MQEDIKKLQKDVLELSKRITILSGELSMLRQGQVKRSGPDESIMQTLMTYIVAHGACKRSDVYNLSIFSRNKVTRKKQYDVYMDELASYVDSFDKELNILPDGKAVRHYITQKV